MRRGTCAALVVLSVCVARGAIAADPDPEELLRLAKSEAPAELRVLLARMQEPATLAVLKRLQEKARRPAKCGLGAPPYRPFDACLGARVAELPLTRVLCALATGKAGPATLIALGRSRAFAKDEDLMDLLFQASTGVRPPPAGLLALWDGALTPGSAFSNYLEAVLLDNESPAALALLARKYLDPRFEESRAGWAFSIHVRRERASTLELAGRLLAGRLPREARLELVRALFAKQLSSPSGFVPRPWSQAAKPLQAKVKAIGARALKLPLPAELRAEVAATLKAL